jgi:proteic killer suppression protein
VIRSFKHKGLQEFFYTGNKKGIIPSHANRIARILDRLDASISPLDMNLPGFKYHKLEGKYAGYFAVCVSGNLRIIFQFEGEDAIFVNYLDYH